MTEILEIRDDCKTPSELIESKTFTKYLEIYKKKFINDLNTKKGSDQNEEAIHKIEFIKCERCSGIFPIKSPLESSPS